ncbi:MAG: universal stress protein, partial [Proteobacteria bacterium]|nr:universal stress protein [Pseudomonadota bacterium]
MAEHRTRILLAVDGSDQAFEAARYASQLFAPDLTDVVLFHVTTRIPESFWDIEEDPELMLKEAAPSASEHQQVKEIQQVMERARQLFLDRGVPEDAVIAKIQERKVGIARDIFYESKHAYNAVVVGRWGMSLLKDFLWGSIADKLLGRLTHVPLCVVGGTPHVGKILVALDASKGAMRAVDYVSTIADGSDLEVTLYHAVRALDEEVFHKAEKSMKSVFEKAIGRLENAGFRRNQITARTATGVLSRAGAIIQYALKGEYGTIVVGRRGLSEVEEFP